MLIKLTDVNYVHSINKLFSENNFLLSGIF